MAGQSSGPKGCIVDCADVGPLAYVSARQVDTNWPGGGDPMNIQGGYTHMYMLAPGPGDPTNIQGGGGYTHMYMLAPGPGDPTNIQGGGGILTCICWHQGQGNPRIFRGVYSHVYVGTRARGTHEYSGGYTHMYVGTRARGTHEYSGGYTHMYVGTRARGTHEYPRHLLISQACRDEVRCGYVLIQGFTDDRVIGTPTWSGGKHK